MVNYAKILHNSGEGDKIPLQDHPVFLRGLFSITLIAILLTVFEIVFYVAVAVPQIQTSLKRYFPEERGESLKKLETSSEFNSTTGGFQFCQLPVDDPNASEFCTLRNDPTDLTFKGFFNVLDKRETERMKDSNITSIVIMSLFVLLLIIFLSFLYERLKSRSHLIYTKLKEPKRTHLVPVVITSLITILFICAFQFFFFLFGLEFLYTGTLGEQEIENVVITEIREYFNLEPLSPHKNSLSYFKDLFNFDCNSLSKRRKK